MRTAIRRGWLNDAPQADRDALVARFEQAVAERRADDPEGRNVRALLAECWAMLEAEGANLRETMRVLRYAWAGEWPTRMHGRPRERWHVTDCPGRIDAADVRRRALAAGMDLGSLTEVRVSVAVEGQSPVTVAIRVDARPGEVGGWRVFLCCPRCGHRRVSLYAAGTGIACRRCNRIGYRDASALTAPRPTGIQH
jgi:hypothetical protein